MIVHTIKMCTADAGPEQSLTLFYLLSTSTYSTTSGLNQIYRFIPLFYKVHIGYLSYSVGELDYGPDIHVNPDREEEWAYLYHRFTRYTLAI